MDLDNGAGFNRNTSIKKEKLGYSARTQTFVRSYEFMKENLMQIRM